MRKSVLRCLLGALGAVLCLGLAQADITSDFVGKGDYTAEQLFSDVDVGALSDWDLDHIWLGSGGDQRGRPVQGSAGAADGVVYTLAHGYNGDSDTGTTGVLRYDPNDTEPLTTAFQRTEALYPIQSMTLVALDDGVTNALLASGDLLLLDGDDLYALDPEVGDEPVEVVEGTWSSGPYDDVRVSGDGTIFVRTGSSLYRIDYDAGDEDYGEPELIWDYDAGGLYAWDVGPDGYAYAYLNERLDNGNPSKNIIRIDPDGSMGYTDFFAKAGGVWSDVNGFTFHTDGELYSTGYKKKKSPPYYFSKRNNKAKFPYGKRIAEWPKAVESGVDIVLKSAQSSFDESFVVVLRTLGSDHRKADHAVWRVAE